MSEDRLMIEPQDARELWARLASEGKAPSELTFAGQVLPTYSVGIEPWIDRLARTYLQELCRRHAHFKLVIGPYGGGKTHFLMALGSRALKEGFAVAYVACTQGISLDSPLDVFRAFMKTLHLPGEDRPGLNRFLRRVIAHKRSQIHEAGAPDPDAAFSLWLDAVASDDHPENAFGRVMAEALRTQYDPVRAVAGDAALRWLQGDVDTLTREDLAALRLAKVPVRAKGDLGRNLLLSVARFLKEAGVNGAVVLFDEVETLFTASGKALDRVLAAMRVMVDLPTGVPGGVPLFGVFAGVYDVLEKLTRYPALEQRLMVKGVPFHEGGDFAPQIHLDKVAGQEELLRSIGVRLIALGELARGYEFNKDIQMANVERLAHVAAERNLEIAARRLFVKTWVNLLDLQTHQGEKNYSEEELASRYRGSFESLRNEELEAYEP
ncbi:BREX system ATP-binding domain-containing protein [Deferrisoma palaeochoriense]